MTMPQMDTREDRPPYVQFMKMAVEDREASIKAGCHMTKDVDFAIITPVGTKDRIPRNVGEWFAQLAEQVKHGRFSPLWLDGYRKSYELWKQGLEIPLNGTPIRTWPVLSPAQIANLTELRVLTVEDLARANEETLGRIGMGAVALKQRAVDWLRAANDTGKIAQELAAMRQEMADMRQRSEALATRNSVLEQEIRQLRPTPEPPTAASLSREKRLAPSGEVTED